MNNHDTPSHGLKSKTIKSVLRNKVNAWLESIEDEDLRKLCHKEAIVTGGCIASMLLGQEVNDFDIYFKTKDTVKKVADYYVKKFIASRKKQGGVPINMFVEELEDLEGKPRVRVVVKSAGVAGENQKQDYQYFENGNDHDAGQYVNEAFDPLSDVKELSDQSKTSECEPFSPVFLSSNAISLHGKIQLILRFYGDPETIHGNYDFVHCMNYWESDRSSLVLRPESLEALLSKTLVYRGSKYPFCSVIRARKFIERGWRINAGQYLKMAMQISKLDMADHQVLEEQLTGVDVAYFSEVIEKLKDKDANKVDNTYLIEIIDRMF